MVEQEKYDILKKEVDSLQIQLSESHKPWHQNPSIIIAVAALLFSFGTTGVSYFKSHQEDVRANRREARELIQRITKLPIENYELMQRHKGSAFGESLSGMINQENIVLASQAVELIRRYPHSFSSPEYFSVAQALSQSNIRNSVPFLFENAIQRAQNANDYNVSTRAYAAYHFTQNNISEGRRLYEQSLDVWSRFPEQNPYIIYSFDLVTLMYWSNSELIAGNNPEAIALIGRAKNCLEELSPGPVTESLTRQIADVESRIEQALRPIR